MVSTYYENDPSFDFQSLGEVGGLWDDIFSVSPIDDESFTVGPSSVNKASVSTKDPPPLVSPMDSTIDIDLPPLDTFDITASERPNAQAMISSTSPTVSYGVPGALSMPQLEYQNVEHQDCMPFNFGSTVGCHREVEDCVPLSCRVPMAVSSQPRSERNSESASSDSKISSRRKSSPSNNKVRKQPNDIEGSLHGTQGPRGSKTAHSIIERKYRENLNSKITQLQEALSVADCSVQEDSRLPNEAPALNGAKPRKGDILTRTIDYIQQAEIDKRHMSEEIKLLRSQLTTMKRPSGCEDCPLVNQLRSLQLQVPIKI